MSKIALICILPMGLWAQEIDENALFADSSLTIVNQDSLKVSVQPSPAESNSSSSANSSKSPSPSLGATLAEAPRNLALSGELSQGYAAMWTKSGSLLNSNSGSAAFGNSSGANTIAALQGDVRIPGGVRGLGEVQMQYLGSNDSTIWAIKELFVDANLDDLVYLRAGKQVLQWGRGILWSPGDLVNTQGNTFLQRFGFREGTYGFKVHVPLGSRINFYSFLNLDSVSEFKQLAWSNRAEAVLGPVELGLASWAKSGQAGVGSADFSTGLAGWDFYGEGTYFTGELRDHLSIDHGQVTINQDKNCDFYRAMLGFSKSFAVNGIPDRWSFQGEYFYKGDGLDPSVYENSTNYVVGRSSNASPLQATVWQILLNPQYNMYQQYQLAKQYVGLYTQFGHVYFSDLSIFVQGIVNVSDHSASTTSGLSWTGLQGAYMQFSVMNTLGSNSNSEAKIFGLESLLNVQVGFRF